MDHKSQSGVREGVELGRGPLLSPQLKEGEMDSSRHDIRGLRVGCKLRELSKGGVDVRGQNKNIGERGESPQEETEELDNKAAISCQGSLHLVLSKGSVVEVAV